MYFKNPQPRGGKVYDGSISELLNATVPKTINSTENSSILREIVNDTLSTSRNILADSDCRSSRYFFVVQRLSTEST